jgi:hypothetical protein
MLSGRVAFLAIPASVIDTDTFECCGERWRWVEGIGYTGIDEFRPQT